MRISLSLCHACMFDFSSMSRMHCFFSCLLTRWISLSLSLSPLLPCLRIACILSVCCVISLFILKCRSSSPSLDSLFLALRTLSSSLPPAPSGSSFSLTLYSFLCLPPPQKPGVGAVLPLSPPAPGLQQPVLRGHQRHQRRGKADPVRHHRSRQVRRDACRHGAFRCCCAVVFVFFDFEV